MNFPRPVVAVVAALALLGGPAMLTACSDPSGLARNDGDSSDGTHNLSGNNPTGVSQGNLPQDGSPAKDAPPTYVSHRSK